MRVKYIEADKVTNGAHITRAQFGLPCIMLDDPETVIEMDEKTIVCLQVMYDNYKKELLVKISTVNEKKRAIFETSQKVKNDIIKPVIVSQCGKVTIPGFIDNEKNTKTQVNYKKAFESIVNPTNSEIEHTVRIIEDEWKLENV